MVSSEIVDYVNEQLKAGFRPEDIRAALAEAGWSEDEIADAFSQVTPQIIPPVRIGKPRNRGRIFSIIGGLLIFVAGLEAVLTFPLISTYLPVMNSLGIIESAVPMLYAGTAMLAFAILVVIGSLINNRSRKGVIIVLVFSILSLAGFYGILILAGSILGIIGGVLSLKR